VPVFEEIVEDALTTVRLVPRWDLEPEEWHMVQAALERLDRSVAARDAPGVRQALEDIEAHGPTRLAAIPRAATDAPVRREPPQGVLDLVNTLIHPSATWTGSTPGTSRSSGQGT
jgi:hypothetical protein